MNWFIAKNVFQTVVGEGNHQAQFEEQMTLIQSVSVENAFEKAVDFGMKAEHQFQNENGEFVQWKFVNTAVVHPISSLSDGAVLCVRTEEPDNAHAYISWVNESVNLVLS